MPAADSVTDFSNRVSLRRNFYSDRGKDYMLVGVPWSLPCQSPRQARVGPIPRRKGI